MPWVPAVHEDRKSITLEIWSLKRRDNVRDWKRGRKKESEKFGKKEILREKKR